MERRGLSMNIILCIYYMIATNITSFRLFLLKGRNNALKDEKNILLKKLGLKEVDK